MISCATKEAQKEGPMLKGREFTEYFGNFLQWAAAHPALNAPQDHPVLRPTGIPPPDAPPPFSCISRQLYNRHVFAPLSISTVS